MTEQAHKQLGKKELGLEYPKFFPNAEATL
jgi:hypothetical protein